ncbi:PAS domain S-box protein, partial [Undibacterium terreum]|uniref:PAS domain S-box protein n=1 Tax=Undibacterium terreum TaxID=1224302 RepID=UPI00166B669D
DGEFVVQAEAKTCGSSVSINLCETPVSADQLPTSVIRYAARTREIVILDDTSVTGPHFSDQYISAHGVRSLLCLPLMKQGTLVALLYLENRLVPGVFTPGRISVLKVLASQAAISLEHSRLYRELQMREAEIRRLVDANIVGIMISDLEGRIFEANDAFLRVVGYGREDLVAGRLRWTDLTPPESLAQELEHTIPQFELTGNVQPFEKEYIHKNGHRVPVLIGVAGFADERNRVLAFVIDMTERKQAEKELRRSR